MHARPGTRAWFELFELSVEEECEGWRNGTLDTWSDPKERRQHDSSPGGFTSQNGQDRLLWEHLFARLRRRGRYLDVAANNMGVEGARLLRTALLQCIQLEELVLRSNATWENGQWQISFYRILPTVAPALK